MNGKCILTTFEYECCTEKKNGKHIVDKFLKGLLYVTRNQPPRYNISSLILASLQLCHESVLHINGFFCRKCPGVEELLVFRSYLRKKFKDGPHMCIGNRTVYLHLCEKAGSETQIHLSWYKLICLDTFRIF